MLKTKIALLALCGLVASCVDAQNSGPAANPEATIRKNIEPRLAPGAKIISVTKTPYAGLYELRAGGEIFYTDEKGQYLVMGPVFEAATSKNLTQARLDEINKIKFDELPLDDALKLVKGNGKRVIAIFEDPNCGYCKRFRQTTLQQIDNITVYTFMYNILSDDSFAKSRNIWCAPDRNKAWDDWMIKGIEAPPAPASCQTPNDRITALGQKLNIRGTPAIFFADGSRIPGAVDLKTLEDKLATLK
jgi:thiol:disulfide interchange protein DsbC